MSTPGDQVQTNIRESGDAGMSGAIDAGISQANYEADPANAKAKETERAEVKKLNEEYTTARVFDEPARKRYMENRRYAQGVADVNWASDANIIGSFIDILKSFLYAQNPDVSVRPSPQAGGQPNKDMTDFAETLQIVISRLWKDAKIKKQMRRVVLSCLSVGVGWVKVLAYSEKRPFPQLENQLSDMQDNLKKIQQEQQELADLDGGEQERALKMLEIQRQMQGLQARVEKLIKKGLCIDFVRAEDMQVSLDVADITDHVEAGWNSNDMYIPQSEATARFERLQNYKEEFKSATIYHQRRTGPDNPNTMEPASQANVTEGQFAKATDNPGMGTVIVDGQNKPVAFVKVVELWDRRTNLIKTFIDGVKCWAVEPYPPPQASTRFYPYFRVAFYETDGTRHPQSLTDRMMKLQDEYSHTRSNGRLVRERSVPGTIFNRGQLDPKDVEKIENSTHLEMVGIQPTNNDLPLDKVMAAKPIPRVDPELYNTAPIMRDMQVVSGVQEAQAQQQTSGPNTATEAEIQNSGFASRTGADRDTLEDVLTEMAQYTAECAVQSLTAKDVQRIAGPLAFWLEGMDVEDVLTLVEVEIQAGTTGKPQARADKETLATLLPLVQNASTMILQLEAAGDPVSLAQAKGQRELMRVVLHRLDDRLDIDSVIPKLAAPALPGAAGAAGAAGAPGAAPVPPAAGAPPVGNGTVNNPGTATPPAPPA